MGDIPLVKRQKLRIRKHDITPLLNVTSLRINVSARSGYVTATLTMHDVDLDMGVGVVKMQHSIRLLADVTVDRFDIGRFVEGFKDGWTCHGFALPKPCPYCKTEAPKR